MRDIQSKQALKNIIHAVEKSRVMWHQVWLDLGVYMLSLFSFSDSWVYFFFFFCIRFILVLALTVEGNV